MSGCRRSHSSHKRRTISTAVPVPPFGFRLPLTWLFQSSWFDGSSFQVELVTPCARRGKRILQLYQQLAPARAVDLTNHRWTVVKLPSSPSQLNSICSCNKTGTKKKTRRDWTIRFAEFQDVFEFLISNLDVECFDACLELFLPC